MTLKDALREAGRAYLERVLAEKRGNVSKAAMEAGIARPTFYKYMGWYGIAAPRLPRPRSSTGRYCTAASYGVQRTGQD